MAISLDATSSSTSTELETSRSWTHTIGTSKGNRCLFVTIGSGYGLTTGISVTYGGTAMTNCADITSGTYNLHSAIFYLRNPPTGSNTVAISWSTSAYASCAALSLYDVSQASPVFGSAVTQTETSGGVSLTIPITGGCWAIDAVAFEGGGAGLTVGAGQTQLVNNDTFRGAASYEGYTDGASSIAMTWSKAVAVQSVSCGVAINPASGRGSPVVSPFMRF